MAKIIQIKGWKSSHPNCLVEGKEEIFIFNADYITEIKRITNKEIPITSISCLDKSYITFNNEIYTKLSVEELIKLVND